MINASDNTVSSINQLSDDSKRFYLGNESAKKRLLILGNSITKHGPKKEIGWEYDWGMAASKRENDYVHLLQSRLDLDGFNVYTMVRQAATWENNFANGSEILDHFKKERDFKADVILFRLGENVHLFDSQINAERFYDAIKDLIEFLSKKDTKVLFTTCFWKSDLVNESIKRAAVELKFPCLELSALSQLPNAMATGKFWHEGVQMHPSDVGMKEIEKTIYPQLIKLL